MDLSFQVISPSDLDEIYRYAEKRLVQQVPNEMERTLHSWHVRWRKEALEHYLPMGWSFVVRSNNQTVGFFLAQPFLFFRGQTQTLWVEHVQADSVEILEALVDVAVRTSREKHLQRVLFSAEDKVEDALEKWRPQITSDQLWEVKTTKG